MENVVVVEGFSCIDMPKIIRHIVCMCVCVGMNRKRERYSMKWETWEIELETKPEFKKEIHL